MKAFFLFLLVFSISSCGRKSVVMEPSSMGFVASLIVKKELINTKTVNEQVCIDNILTKEMNEKEKIRRVMVNTDISFCNGSRLKLKIFKMNDSKLRIYGYAESSLGKASCLRDGSDFKKAFFKGYEGTLTGEGIKIALGGHSYSSDSKLIKNEKNKSQFVNFDGVSFKGEMAIFQDNELVCNEVL